VLAIPLNLIERPFDDAETWSLTGAREPNKADPHAARRGPRFNRVNAPRYPNERRGDT
jgi:hypothetical protein